ncbi:MAG: cellulase family glycosylhydrolase [Candidatus Eremiobacteraeota bacterium]|nr:cellulase family glycosylhydrolase [Candidatus Eremiobacteraeota bacterium]
MPQSIANSRAVLLPTQTGSATIGIKGLHVVNNHVVDAAGKRFIPHGVDRSGTEFACVQNFGIFDGPSDQASVAAIASWHTSAVRVPLNEDCWLAINGVNSEYSGPNYINAIKAFVTLLNSNGLAAILDLHWNAPGTQLATGQEPMADSDHSPKFWKSVASTFKGNLSVIFDLYNEPYVTSWACWRDGGTANACGTSFNIAGMNTLISAVRSTGAKNIVMAGGLAYSNDLSQWLAYEPTDPAGNLAASVHVYNFNSCNSTACYNSTIAPVIAKVPVIPGEIGENDCADGFIDPLMAWFDAHKTGYVGWAWNADFDCSSGPSLITDYDGTPTAYGIGLRDHLAGL